MSKGRLRPGKTEVVQFPPLPRIPRAPVLPVDQRQSRTARVIASVAEVASGSVRVGGPNFSTGFHASAVNLGQLQGALSLALSRFEKEQLEARWDEIFDWMRQAIRAWVQRCKRMKIERRELGVDIELETQDDHGYYSYAFSVFPRNSPRKKAPR